MKNIRLLAGKKGLDNLIRWFHVVETPFQMEYLLGGELIFIMGIVFDKDKNLLIKLVEIGAQKRIAGIVIITGPFISSVSKELIDETEKHDIPLFTIPWEARLVDITQEICAKIISNQIEQEKMEHLLDSILFNEIESESLICKQALSYGIDLSQPKQIFAAGVFTIQESEREQLRDLNRHFEEEKNKLIQMLYRDIQSILKSYNEKFIILLKNDEIIWLMSPQGTKEHISKELVSQIQIRVQACFKDVTFKVGVGSPYRGVKLLRKSLYEAQYALKFTQGRHFSSNICSYKELGIYRLLMNMKDETDLKRYVEDYIGLLEIYDRRHDVSLLETLEIFLNENGNTIRTAEKLYIHRNTLNYRLKKIEELLGCSLSNARDRLDLQVAYKIRNFYNSIHII